MGVLGAAAGAVKTPAEVIVPVAAEPPTTPFTCQCSLADVAPALETAVN